MYQIKSAFKNKSKISPGAAIAKNPNVAIVLTDDLVSSPVRNEGGVKQEGNYTFKPGTKPVYCYMTISKQEPTYESDGEEDGISIMQKFQGFHPGDELEINELIQNLISKNVIIIYGSCEQKFKKVYGTKCAPLQLKPGFAANNDSTGHTLVFEQFAKSAYLPAHWEGDLPEGDAYAVGGLTVDALEANGLIYKLDGSAVAAATVDITSTDLTTGTYVTLIGGGGAEPATLSDGASTGATVLLKGGADWTALEGATIDLEVFANGGTTYLIERHRS